MSSISIGSLTTLNIRSLKVPIGWLGGACTSGRTLQHKGATHNLTSLVDNKRVGGVDRQLGASACTAQSGI